MKNKTEGVIIKEMAHFIRIVEALSSAAISITLPGALENINPKSTEKVTSNIKASGTLAVFVIVYFIEPINFA